MTLTGAGLDNSYIHSGFRNADGQWVEQEVVFLSGEPDRMVFQFTVGEPVIGWRVQIHTLGDAPVQVDGIAVSAVG